MFGTRSERRAILAGRLARRRWRIRAALGRGPEVVGGEGLRLIEPLRISGEGTVVLGSDIEIPLETRLEPSAPDARIELGSNLSLREVLIGGPGTTVLADRVRMHGPEITTQRPGARIEMGERTLAGKVKVESSARITIGVDCLIGGSIVDADYHFTRKKRRGLGPVAPDGKPVVIGDNVWLGAASVVLKGVTVGDNSVVGLGAVVTHDIPPDRIWAGNPARDVGPIPDE